MASCRRACVRLLYALGAGTWSDRHGRKPLLVLAVAGQLLVSLSYGLNYALLTQLDWHWLYLELVSRASELPQNYVVLASWLLPVSIKTTQRGMLHQSQSCV